MAVNNAKKLEQFRDGKITKHDVLELLIPGDIHISILVTKDHLIHMLDLYKHGKINKSYLVDWVNGIWFSDSFEYKADQSSSIASVMSELEKLDESNNNLSEETIDYYIDCLNKNIET